MRKSAGQWNESLPFLCHNSYGSDDIQWLGNHDRAVPELKKKKSLELWFKKKHSDNISKLKDFGKTLIVIPHALIFKLIK